MKIAIAQLNFLVGDIEGNAERILLASKKINADVIVFPELALCGYPPEDLLYRPALYIRCENALQHIAKNTFDKSLIVGYPSCRDGKIYNQAAFIAHGKIAAMYAKQELPNNTVFDEKRYFVSGNTPCVMTIQDIECGIIICEDLWHPDPIMQAKNHGAECIIVINASPYDRKQMQAREAVIQQRISETQLPVIYANLVGGQDELVFDGSSMVFDREGNKILQAPSFCESILVVDVEKQRGALVFSKAPLPKKHAPEQEVYEALTLGVHDYIYKNKLSGALIGLSGGIDSALTLAIAVDALGADNVTAIIMPSQYTADMSVEDAVKEAEKLNVHYEIISIDSLLDAYLKNLSSQFEHTKPDITEENLQARIRGNLLMALSNKFGKIVLTTSNKSEMSVGYSTLYGDMVGGFAVLKDVSKTLVYQLARYRNTISEVIPERVITRAPTAELRNNQTDQDKLPPYDVLDAILERYIEKDEDAEEIIKAGFDKKIVLDVIKMINGSEYKRRQAPIGVRITKRGFGKDRRYPITSGY